MSLHHTKLGHVCQGKRRSPRIMFIYLTIQALYCGLFAKTSPPTARFTSEVSLLIGISDSVIAASYQRAPMGLLLGSNHDHRYGNVSCHDRSCTSQSAIFVKAVYRNTGAIFIHYVSELAGRIDDNAEGLRSCCDGGRNVRDQVSTAGVNSEHRNRVVHSIHDVGEFAGWIHGYRCGAVSCNGDTWRIRSQDSGDGIDSVLRHRVSNIVCVGDVSKLAGGIHGDVKRRPSRGHCRRRQRR